MKRTFVDVLCSGTYLFRRVMQFVIVLLVMLAVSLMFIEPGSSSYYIAILNLFVLVPLLLASGGIIYYCKQTRGRKTVSAVDPTDDTGE